MLLLTVIHVLSQTVVYYLYVLLQTIMTNVIHIFYVPVGSPSRGGDVVLYAFDINQLSLLTPFYSLLVSISVFVAILTVFHSIHSPDNSPFSQSVLPFLSLPHWFFQLYYISLYESLLQP